MVGFHHFNIKLSFLLRHRSRGVNAESLEEVKYYLKITDLLFALSCSINIMAPNILCVFFRAADFKVVSERKDGCVPLGT